MAVLLGLSIFRICRFVFAAVWAFGSTLSEKDGMDYRIKVRDVRVATASFARDTARRSFPISGSRNSRV